jgi:polysaccharide biosynthesis transport protein
MSEAYTADVEPVDNGHDEPRGISIYDVLVAIRRRWWLVASAVGIILSIGYWHTIHEHRLYRATATIRLQAGQQMITGVSNLQTRIDYRIDPLLSEQALIRSEQVAERVVKRLGLQFHIANPPGMSIQRLFGEDMPQTLVDLTSGRRFAIHLDPAGYAATIEGRRYAAPYGMPITTGTVAFLIRQRPPGVPDDVVVDITSLRSAAGFVRGGLATKAVPSTDLVEISFTGEDREQVRDVANSVAHVYQEFASEGIKNSATQKTKFIEQSLAEQERALRAVQDSLKSFKETHQTADVTADAKALFASIESFERERLEAENKRQSYVSLLSKVTTADTIDDELRRLAAAGAMDDNKALTTKFEVWQSLLQKRQDMMLQRNLLPNNDDLVALDRTIADTKRDLRIATEVYLDGLNSKLQTLQRTIADLRGQSERFPPLEAQQARLDASVQTAQKLYVDLRSQLQLSRISESADGGTVRIIDEATVPNFAISPNRKRDFYLYLMLGLTVGVALALLVERLDDSVRSPLELSERYGTAVLGMIPAIKPNEIAAAAPSLAVSRIITHADPRSPVAEAYRSLRTNLAFARSQRPLRSLALTSPGPSDGKSTTVANLAITFAQQGQRTLLVDADLRRAVLDKTFGVPRTPGLTDVIIGAHSIEEAAHATQVPNLYIMSSGQLPPNPSELLGSAPMREQLQRMTEQFDMVLFDSPPLLAVTDAAVLSTLVDGTVLIARMGATARKGLWRALGQLRAVHANLLGTVLNDVSSEVGAYYGGYSYYYYYSYHPEGTNGRLNAGLLGRLRRLTTGVTGGGGPKWG